MLGKMSLRAKRLFDIEGMKVKCEVPDSRKRGDSGLICFSREMDESLRKCKNQEEYKGRHECGFDG